MKEIRDVLTPDQIIRAKYWWGNHIKHIRSITKNIETTFPPTDSEDKNDPALWKPEHWGWFIHNGSLAVFNNLEIKK